MLKVDKENLEVSYNDELHKYWVKSTEQSCVSVTTLIHHFTNFDEDFWSSYKALEAMITKEQFKTIKSELVSKKIFKEEYLEPFNISLEEFKESKKTILEEWQEKRETSCIRGTKFHKEQEDLHLEGKTKELKSLGLGGTFNVNTSNILKVGESGVFPELLMSRVSDDGILRIAGQADLVIIDDLDVYILDYKTSKEIKTKAYFNRNARKFETLKYPLNNIEDTNFWHYTMQLSTYAWMIQKIDPRFNIKLLRLIHYDHDGNMENYDCEYRKVEVERMLAFHKRGVQDEIFKNKHKKIEI